MRIGLRVLGDASEASCEGGHWIFLLDALDGRLRERRCVQLRLETRALFGPTGSIVDRDPLGVT